MTYLKASPAGRLDRLFTLAERGTSVRQEIRGGLATFMAIASVVVVNPIILGGAKDATGAVLSVPQLATMTALSGALSTLLMAFVGNAPLALATGGGLNAVVAYQAAPLMTWPQAMGLVILDGVIILILSVSGFRARLMDAIPQELKYAIGAGIGCFIALIGMVATGFVSAGEGTPLTLGTQGHLQTWPVAVFVIGLMLTTLLYARRIPGAILISIAVTTVLAIVIDALFSVPEKSWGNIVPNVPSSVLSMPDFGLFGHVDLFGGFVKAGFLNAGIILITLALSGFFDAMGTILTVADKAEMTDPQGKVPRLGRILVVDGLATALGGFTSSSANSVYVESAVGVDEGARTGLSSVVTGGLFGVTLFLTPLAGVVPAQAAMPAVVVVGALMMAPLGKIKWSDVGIGVPAFLTIVMMPFTYSITNGIGMGILAYVLIKTVRGVRVGWPLWTISLVFAAYFAVTPLRELFTS